MEALYKRYSSLDAVGCVILNDIGLPSRLVSGQIDTLLPDKPAWDAVVREQTLSVAPGLMQALAFESPPSLAFLKALPQPNGPGQPKQWGIYALVFEKAGCRPQVYVGSGTHAEDRVRGRFRGYYSGAGPWSRHTTEAINDGYTMSSAGLLCWTSLPPPQQVLRQRARLITLEAVLALNLVAVRPTGFDVLFDEFYLWDREAMPWLPLCSHVSLNEGVARNIQLSEAELIEVAARRVERNRLKTERHRKRKREEDEEAFLQKGRDQQVAWSAKNPGRVNELAAGQRQKAKDAGWFYCPDCDHNFTSQYGLDDHNGTQAHSDAVQNGGPVEKTLSASYLRKKAKRAAAIANKDFYCDACEKPFGDQMALTRHNNQKHTH
jgi:hypothetical protein